MGEVDVMSVSRIESSAGLVMLEASASAEPPAISASESRAQKKASAFLRACHLLLNSVEECLFLILCHCHYYLARDALEQRRQAAQLARFGGSSVNATVNNSATTNASMMSVSFDSSTVSRSHVSSQVKISDELSSSVLRQITKIDKLLETRLHGSPPASERAMLTEKRAFLSFCASHF
jgi:hypothetical protein